MCTTVNTLCKSSYCSYRSLYFYCIDCILRKMRKLRIGCVNAQYMRKICARISHNAQDCTSFSQCAIYAQDMCKICARIVLIPQMRNICARFAQDRTSFRNAQNMRKIVLLSSMRNICARFAQNCTSFPMRNICATFAQDCTSFSNAQHMPKICARLYLFPQCTIYAQDCTYFLNVQYMRKICARFVQDLCKIVLLLQCAIYAQICTSL